MLYKPSFLKPNRKDSIEGDSEALGYFFGPLPNFCLPQSLVTIILTPLVFGPMDFFFFLPFSCSTKGLIKEHEGRGSSAQNCRLRAPLYFEDNGSRPGNLPGLWADFTASAHVSTVDVILHLWGGGVAGFFRPVQTPERVLAQKV